MKLIDLLVQELPKRGGWPDGAERCAVGEFDGDSITVAFCFPKGYSDGFDVPFRYTVTIPTPGRHVSVATDCCMITRYLYESALAASQKPAWNGEGLPPVGCECEWRDSNVGWLHVKIKYISEQIVVIESPTNLCGVQKLTEIAKDIICDKPQFRPLRTEADKKRERICDAIYGALTRAERQHNRSDEAEAVYDAIAAGKIPGVKLED